MKKKWQEFRRRFPLILLIAIAARVLWVWLVTDLQRQDKYIQTAVMGIIFYGLMLLWMFLLAPIPWRKRVLFGLAMVIPVVVVASATRIRGVTGDLVPILEWRWSKAERPAATTPLVAEIPSANTNAAGSLAKDYPQLYGPERDGRVDVALGTNWGMQPPQELWRKPIGAAWSGFSVVGERAVTQEQEGENELVTCYELRTGKLIWKYSSAGRYATTIAGEGPRATPTISSNLVYTFGGTGVLNCIELGTGKLVWSHDVLKEHGGGVPDWGMASSPLVTDKHVVVSAGGSKALVAYDRVSGNFAWISGSDSAGYSSPALAELLGERVILNFNGHSSGGFNPVSGEELWKHPWPLSYPNVTMPLAVSSNLVFITTGYGRGSELLRVGKTEANWTVESLYKSNRLKSKFSNIFLVNGFIYGMDDGIMTCIDAKDGSQKWKNGRYGHCQMILANDLLVFITEGGELKLVQPNPNALTEVASMKVFRDKTWNPSTLAGPYLIARNDLEAACFLLPLAGRAGIAVADNK